MYKDILRSIAGIDVFPVLSLVIFLTVFTAVVVYAVRLDRRRLATLASLPLDEGDALPAQALSQTEPGETR
jgi:hypothetical protein